MKDPDDPVKPGLAEKAPPGDAVAPTTAAEPAGIPVLTRCKACGADLSTISYCAAVDLPAIEQQPARILGGKLVPGGTRLVIRPQLLRIMPQACPECRHPLFYLAPAPAGGRPS